MGQPGHNDKPPPRGIVQGWTAASIRRNRNFLYSVDVDALALLLGIALTLTLRDCPPTAEEWGKLRKAFLEALRRDGVVLVHWVTEWQRRGVPHLHLAIFLPLGTDPAVFARHLIAHWIRIAAAFGARPAAQFWNPIYDALGWNQYLSKHAARGLHHYQRSSANVPPAWRGGSAGRLWGKIGKWTLCPEMPVQICWKGFAFLRRLLRSWRVADARQAVGKAKTPEAVRGALRRLQSARGMLRCTDPDLSRVRGCSEWFGQDLMFRALALASDLGYVVES